MHALKLRLLDPRLAHPSTGPLAKKVAGRVSFSGTQRDGTIRNVKTGVDVNNLDNFGVRGQSDQ
jgi:hypothetical protein